EADLAASRTELRGTIRVATFQTAAYTLVLDAIDRLTARYPDLTVAFTHVHAEAAILALMARDFDLVLSEEYPGNPAAPHPGVTTTAVATDPLLLAVPAAWSTKGPADLANAPWVMEHPHTPARTWSTAVCRAAGYEPRVRYETADLRLQATIVDRGLAAALLPRLGHRPSPGVRLIPTGQARTIT